MDKIIKKLSQLVKGSKFENHIFAVGGCVRDKIMGKTPKDIDICVDLPNGGVEFVEWVCNTYPESCKNMVIYPAFGTAKFSLLVGDKWEDIEAVQTRSEQYHDTNSRNPETVFGTIHEDAFRRDLTINALYQNISNDEIIDVTGMGLSDIENHIIRTTTNPDIIYNEDPLRMLRTIRFSTRFGWKIDDSAYDSIKKNALRLSIISKERISDELSKIIVCENVSYGLNLLKETTLLEQFIPEFKGLYNMEQNKFHFGSVWEHTVAVVEKTKPIFINRLSALLHDIGKLSTFSTDANGVIHFYKHELDGEKISLDIMKRLKLPNDVMQQVCFTIVNHMRTKSFGDNITVKDKSIRKLQADLGKHFDLVMDVINADNCSHSIEHCMPNQVANIYKKIGELEKIDGKNCFVVKLPINGDDILQIANQTQGGEWVRLILNSIKKLYYSNPNITFNECSKFVEQNLHKYLDNK